jgi:hypothetical protein
MTLSQPCRTGQHRHCRLEDCACGCHHSTSAGLVIPADSGRPGNLRTHQLVDRLNRAVEELDQLMAFLVAAAEAGGMDPMTMQYPDGRPAMAELCVAQAQALAALAQLQAAP